MTRQGQDYPEAVRRKAKRMSAARRAPASLLHNLAHVGVLSWMFILPIVVAAFLGRLLASWSGQRWVTLVVLGIGLVLGAYLVWRQLAPSLGETHEENGDS